MSEVYNLSTAQHVKKISILYQNCCTWVSVNNDWIRASCCTSIRAWIERVIDKRAISSDSFIASKGIKRATDSKPVIE